MRLIVALVCLLVASIGWGQDSVFVQFENEANRHAWVQTGLPSGPPTDGVKSAKATIEVPTKGRQPTDVVFVWDLDKGNLVSRTLRDFKKGESWKVKPTDAWDIAEVEVRVQSNGKPVAAANVLLNDGRRTQRQLVDAGVARFFVVKPGALKVTVEYRSEGKAAKPVTQILEAKLDRDTVVPGITIALPEPVATVAGPPGPASEPNENPATEPRPAPSNPIGSILAYLLALALAVGVGVAIYLYTRKNSDLVASKLEELGVQIPKPGEPEPEPIAAVPVAPEPPQKIVLADSEPTSLATDPTPMAATGKPRLIASNGDELDLAEGELTVGREVGLGLSLVGESTVSRSHAVITNDAGVITVRDLGSTNGTFVNGSKVDEAVLRPGDSVQFGSVRFRHEA